MRKKKLTKAQRERAAEKRAQQAISALKKRAEDSKPDSKNLGAALLVYRPELADEDDPLSGISVVGIYKHAPSEEVLAVHRKIEPEASFSVVSL